MADHDLEIQETFSPSTAEIDFLTDKINEESRAENISSDAYPFGIFARTKSGKQTKSTAASPEPPTPSNQPGSSSGENFCDIIAGCNGSVVYGSIYTDQLWVHPKYRGKGIGKLIMERVHQLGKQKQCTFASVGTMDFQHAQKFYEGLGYQVEFERHGYSNGGKMIYLKKDL